MSCYFSCQTPGSCFSFDQDAVLRWFLQRAKFQDPFFLPYMWFKSHKRCRVAFSLLCVRRCFLFVECCLENQCVLFVLTFVFIAFNFSCNDFVALLLFVCYCAIFCLFCLEKHRVLFFCCLRFRPWLKLDVQSRLEQLQISEPAIAQGNSFHLLPLGPAYSSFSYCPF